MATFTYEQLPVTPIREGAERRLAHGDNLMMVVVDFHDGPQARPDPLHAHPHEQVSYVAAGEIVFVMEGQQVRLKAGGVFVVPSGRPHAIQLLSEHARLIDCFTPIREDFLPGMEDKR
jgi:quercetin dioxygenase-like cupin family protein